MATKGVNITLKEDTIKRVKELAKEQGRSFSNMVEYILYSHCSGKTDPLPKHNESQRNLCKEKK